MCNINQDILIFMFIFTFLKKIKKFLEKAQLLPKSKIHLYHTILHLNETGA